MTRPTQLRWMIRRDLPAVAQIDADAYPLGDRWTEDDYVKVLGHRSFIGLVAERGDTIVGVMVYELRQRSIVLHRVNVGPLFRRQGIGRLMLDRLASKINERRPRVKAHVNEYNLRGHLFLRACGWRCYQILHATEATLYSFERRANAVTCPATGGTY